MADPRLQTPILRKIPSAATHLNTEGASDLRTWLGMMLTCAVLFDISPVKYKRRNMV